jgi:hypothetical protein
MLNEARDSVTRWKAQNDNLFFFLASRHCGGWLGLFIEHLVGAQEIKGLETPFKLAQPPAKTAQNPTQNNGAQSKSGFVPKIYQKNEKI